MTVAARPALRQTAIISHLRGRIVSGELKPGDRLPTRVEIEKFFEASPTTVQRALEQLIADGFVTPAGRRGTFVSEYPPHLYHYALAFPLHADDPNWVRFWTVLASAAESHASNRPVKISLYRGIEPGKGGTDRQRLEDDIASGRLAGVIFAADPWPLKGTAALETPGLPRVAFTGVPGETKVAGVSLGGNAGLLFFEKALDLLASRRRKRAALLTVPGISGVRLQGFRNALVERGLTYQPCWIQTASQAEPHWATHLILLMFRGARAERPDALIIADDNLVEHACAGLLQLGLGVPDDVDVVAHCNFPAPTPPILPVARLGYDIPRVLEKCIGLLNWQRLKEAVPPTTVIAPLFEWETADRSAPRPVGLSAP